MFRSDLFSLSKQGFKTRNCLIVSVRTWREIVVESGRPGDNVVHVLPPAGLKLTSPGIITDEVDRSSILRFDLFRSGSRTAQFGPGMRRASPRRYSHIGQIGPPADEKLFSEFPCLLQTRASVPTFMHHVVCDSCRVPESLTSSWA